MGIQDCSGGMIHYTSYRHIVKGLFIKIPNLLKESEQDVHGKHSGFGSLTNISRQLASG